MEIWSKAAGEYGSAAGHLVCVFGVKRERIIWRERNYD